jgi:hypothetical protein
MGRGVTEEGSDRSLGEGVWLRINGDRSSDRVQRKWIIGEGSMDRIQPIGRASKRCDETG